MVLWGTMLLALMVGAIVPSTRVSTQVVGRSLEVARAEALAEGALAAAVARLFEAELDLLPPTDGRPFELRIGGGAAVVRIQDEDGKLDLRRVSPELLASLLEVLGVSYIAADGLARRILEVVPEAPAEDDDAPHNAERGLVHRLAGVEGMPPGLARRLVELVTVYAEARRVDPQVAPPEVLLAIPGMSQEMVDQIVERRAGTFSVETDMGLTEWRAYFDQTYGITFRMRTEARVGDAVAVREGVYRLWAAAPPRAEILEWSEVWPEELEAAGIIER